MKVAMDATPLTVSSGGIARYTYELSLALAKNFPEDGITLLSDQPFSMPSPASGNLKRGGGPRRAWERKWWLCGVQSEMRRQETEIFHGTHFSVPWLPLRPSVATLHDLSPWMDPSWHQAADRVRRHTPWLAGLGIPTMFLTPTEAVRKEAIERFRIHPRRIVAVPHGAAKWFRPLPEAPDREPYFVCVATLEPRKNLDGLVAAWREARKQETAGLVLAGRSRPGAWPPPPEPGLRVLGEVADEELPALYSGAIACVYPSLYEGFGLPVLEAMQCGAAVIASRDAAITEVAGGAALQVDAGDQRALTEAMVALARRPELAAHWRERSLARAASFSWEKTARLTREVYGEAIRQFGS